MCVHAGGCVCVHEWDCKPLIAMKQGRKVGIKSPICQLPFCLHVKKITCIVTYFLVDTFLLIQSFLHILMFSHAGKEELFLLSFKLKLNDKHFL